MEIENIRSKSNCERLELWCTNNNRSHMAIVSSYAMINFKLISSALDDTEPHVAIGYFSSQTKALEWLAQFGYLYFNESN